MPISRTVTGGSLCLIGSSGRDFNFKSTDLTVAFRLGDAGSFPIVVGIVSAGSSFNPSGTLAGEQTLKSGPVEFQGVAYASLFFSGSLQFTADPVVIPADSAVPLQLKTKFTLSGTLSAFHNNPFVGPPGPAVFEATLDGHGSTVVRCSASHPSGATMVRDLTSLFFGFVDAGGKLKAKIQKTKARSQKPKARRQKPKARGQKPKARSQKPRARRQKPNARRSRTRRR